MDAPPTTALVLPTVTKPTRKRSSLFILISRVVLASWVLRETFNILSTWMEWQFMGSDLVPDSFDLWEEKMTVVHVSTTMNTTALANMTDVKPVAESSSNKIRGGIKASEANSVVIQKFQTAKASTATTFNTTLDLVERSILHQEPPFNISVAVCFKTLFGDIDIGIVIQWAGTFSLMSFVGTHGALFPLG
jgi:hypothetical protein